MQETIERLRTEALAAIHAAADDAALEAVRVGVLGRKGSLTGLLRGLKDLDAEARREAGAALNAAKDELTAALETRQAAIGSSRPVVSSGYDLTLPGRAPAPTGSRHPLLTVLESICDIFHGMGFSRDDGPEVELDYYNFTALNFPDDHPARDIQDTFYISDKVLLRTQTSPVQVRMMERNEPPLACVFPGRVYRNENADASHSSEFFQIEGLVVDRAVSMSDLKDTVDTFVMNFFGGSAATRFRPHYFPFTEPSVEVDMQCIMCGGKGCGVCKQSGWLEIMGAGMVHPNVFRAAGYPDDRYTGFAFGMGIDRIAMLKYGISDIRLLYENDLRFLNQFRGVQ
ncbi:MAG: phenylalanine--tRNA ligase subunit alpha [bacterium]|jgi:phenylalanyl-tRNA synthetase alpha chain|nr:phenylalanine--tRNA ligase subunit alpha [bacterium]